MLESLRTIGKSSNSWKSVVNVFMIIEICDYCDSHEQNSAELCSFGSSSLYKFVVVGCTCVLYRSEFEEKK